jgi:hypothetical protein
MFSDEIIKNYSKNLLKLKNTTIKKNGNQLDMKKI